jgi:hypothetical protein
MTVSPDESDAGDDDLVVGSGEFWPESEGLLLISDEHLDQ